MTDDILARLTTASRRAAELHQALRTELERRNALVIQARDQGHSWHQVARAAELAVSTCETIVARG